MTRLRIGTVQPLTTLIAILMVCGMPVVSQQKQSATDSSARTADVEELEKAADDEVDRPTRDLSACRENRSYCFDAGTFVARLIQVTDGTEGNYNVVRLNIRIENVSGSPLLLAYRAHTSIVVDEYENSYFCCTAKTAPDTSATGIGINQDKDTDSQFKLEPKQIGNVTFQVWGHRARSQESPYFHYDLTIDEMDPNNPRRLQRQHAIYFGDFTATWRKPRIKAGPQTGTLGANRVQGAKVREKH